MKAIFKTTALFLLTLLCSCETAPAAEEHFWLRSKGADMPVLVRGNRDSGIFIIVNPGWPGTGLIYSVDESFQSLERDFTMVYWNFRGAGASKGNPGLENYRMDQFTEDTDLLVDTVCRLYGNPDIFMMGHSFGGEVSGNYLLSPERQAKIKAFIGVEPVLDNRLLDRKLLSDITAYAEVRQEDPYWREVYQWCRTKEVIKPSDYGTLFNYAEEAGIINETGDYTTWYPKLLKESFAQEYGNTSLLMTQFGVYNRFFTPDNYIESLDRIKLPVLLICGAYNKGGFGIDIMQEIASRLGTSPGEKRVLEMESSGHLPFLTEPERFSREIRSYIRSVL